MILYTLFNAFSLRAAQSILGVWQKLLSFEIISLRCSPPLLFSQKLMIATYLKHLVLCYESRWDFEYVSTSPLTPWQHDLLGLVDTGYRNIITVTKSFNTFNSTVICHLHQCIGLTPIKCNRIDHIIVRRNWSQIFNFSSKNLDFLAPP